MPPGVRQLLVAAAGAFALAIGGVAVINGALVGIVFLLGGALLLAWSVWSLRGRR